MDNITELVIKCQKGDSDAFGQLYDLFADRMFKFICLKVSDRGIAEDILQEVFIKSWQGMKTVRLENLNFKAWLYKVTSNTINDHFRKIYRSPLILELDENLNAASDENLADSASKSQDLELIKECINNLPPKHQQILELRFVQDLTIKETADILNKSNLAVRIMQHRALKQLKNILQQQYDIQYKKI